MNGYKITMSNYDREVCVIADSMSDAVAKAEEQHGLVRKCELIGELIN